MHNWQNYTYSLYYRKIKQDGGEENEELWTSVDKENLFQNTWTQVSLPISGITSLLEINLLLLLYHPFYLVYNHEYKC